MIHNSRWIGVLVVLLAAVIPVRAQDASQSGQAAPEGFPSNQSSSQIQPDTHPLAGAYLFTLGSALEGHNYIQPAVSVGETVATNPGYSSSVGQNYEAATIPEASLTLYHASPRNQLSVGYLGGGFIFNNSTALDSTFQAANIGDVVQFRRMSLSLSDQFSYLPSAAFGFGGFGGLGALSGGFFGGMGSSMGQINPAFGGGQSILSSFLSSYNNTAVAQLLYSVSARTSITFMGSYGMLQSGGGAASGFLNGNNEMGSVGYQRALTGRDTIGVSYFYSKFSYTGLPESFAANSIDVDFGRKITGRLALQLYAGPELIDYRTGPNSITSTTASGFGSLSYAYGGNTFSLYGGRFSTMGSGALPGAITDMLSGGWSRQLTRKWSFSLSGGIVRNSGLGIGPYSNINYNYGFAGLSLNRTLGRYTSMYLNYEYQRQLTNAAPCTTSFCAGNLANQFFTVGFTFTPHPIGL